MTFNIPENQEQVINRARTDVQNALPNSNPFFKNSFLGAIVTSFAGRIYDFYLQLNVLIRELFVDTATGSFLERWGSYKDITRNAATKSSGNITATGSISSSINSGSILTDSEGNQFTTTETKVVNKISVNISEIVRSGNTVTVKTVTDHVFASGLTVNIEGADQTDYNGSHDITVIAADQFTYEITTTPDTPATGTITADSDIASINVESVEFGKNLNAANGVNLTFSSPIAGVDDTAFVQFGELSGGSDLESDEDLRSRIIERYKNPVAHFNKNDIITQAKKVTGVTRVWVLEATDSFGGEVAITEITRNEDIATVEVSQDHNLENCMVVKINDADQAEYNIDARVLVIDDTKFAYVVAGEPDSPATGVITMTSSIPLGQLRIFFTRDNDDTIIPNNSEVNTTKDKILEIKPANTADNDVIVSAPNPVTVNFSFSSLSPNTATMQAAITANLEAFFKESTNVGVDVKTYEYESVIFQTVDPDTGDVVSNFTLSDPSGSISVGSDELAILGNVTYI